MISSIHIIISTILVFLSFSSAQNQTQLQIINVSQVGDDSPLRDLLMSNSEMSANDNLGWDDGLVARLDGDVFVWRR